MSQNNSNTGKAIIFSAPSGAGKTTIVHHLLSKPELRLSFSISATSRKRRGKEVDAKDYYFLSPGEFREKVRTDEFLEWEEVYADQMYGTLKSEVKRIWDEGLTVIFDVDVVGGLELKKVLGENALAIFVSPPDFKTLESRLRGRQTESEEKIRMRLEKASIELKRAPEFDVILENDILEKACQKAEQLVSEFTFES